MVDEVDLEAVVAALERGEPVVVPTDTVYGLAALPGVPRAVDQIFDRKGRSAAVPVAVLCATADEALALAEADDVVRTVAVKLWPGPLTLVVPRRADLDWSLGEPSHTIGVRVPDHALIAALTARVGPIATTSANRHGSPTPSTLAEVLAELGDDLVAVDGGRLDGLASTVVDATGDTWRILRAGAITTGELAALGAPVAE